MDFKVSSGYSDSVVVEIKKSINHQLIHAFDKQVEDYKRGERAEKAILLVIKVNGGTDYTNGLLEHAKKARGKNLPEIIVVNGIPSPSASKT